MLLAELIEINDLRGKRLASPNTNPVSDYDQRVVAASEFGDESMWLVSLVLG